MENILHVQKLLQQEIDSLLIEHVRKTKELEVFEEYIENKKQLKLKYFFNYWETIIESYQNKIKKGLLYYIDFSHLNIKTSSKVKTLSIESKQKGGMLFIHFDAGKKHIPLKDLTLEKLLGMLTEDIPDKEFTTNDLIQYWKKKIKHLQDIIKRKNLYFRNSLINDITIPESTNLHMVINYGNGDTKHYKLNTLTSKKLMRYINSNELIEIKGIYVLDENNFNKETK